MKQMGIQSIQEIEPEKWIDGNEAYDKRTGDLQEIEDLKDILRAVFFKLKQDQQFYERIRQTSGTANLISDKINKKI